MLTSFSEESTYQNSPTRFKAEIEFIQLYRNSNPLPDTQTNVDRAVNINHKINMVVISKP